MEHESSTTLGISSKDFYVIVDNGGPENFLNILNQSFLTNETYLNNESIPLDDAKSPDVSEGSIFMTLLTIFLGLMILFTIIGNVFVILAVILEKHLQNAGNYLICSLGVADLLVSCLVMPLAAIYEINRGWILGDELCVFWTILDVLLCTCSILHLVVIALDRYWLSTDATYTRTNNRIFAMILCVWLTSFFVAIAPQMKFMGFKDDEKVYLERIKNQQCQISQDETYQIFATSVTFYIPVCFILILYWKIYQATKSRINKRTTTTFPSNREKKPKKLKHKHLKITSQFSKPKHSSDSNEPTEDEKEKLTKSPDCKCARRDVKKSDADSDNIDVCNNNNNSIPSDQNVNANTSNQSSVKSDNGEDKNSDQQNSKNIYEQIAKRKLNIASEREARIQKILTILTVALLVCWLPFFVTVPISIFFNFQCDILNSIFLWLGYANSLLNPILYNIFNPEFRSAFKKILFGSPNNKNSFYYRRNL